MKRLFKMPVVVGGCIAVVWGIVACGPAGEDIRQQEQAQAQQQAQALTLAQAQQQAQRLPLAPSWIAQLDLPGCDAVQPAAVRSRPWYLLQHPHHDRLVVAALAHRALCVDEWQVVHQLFQPSTAHLLSPRATLLSTDEPGESDDDPIPIQPDDPPADSDSGQEP